MCYFRRKVNSEVTKVYDSQGEIVQDMQMATIVDLNLPEHVDDPFLNRHVQYSILGFRYETKDTKMIVYSSVECKTFCMIMQLSPMKI